MRCRGVASRVASRVAFRVAFRVPARMASRVASRVACPVASYHTLFFYRLEPGVGTAGRSLFALFLTFRKV